MTEREYPWDVLGIDETKDKKRIKKAYAVLIKQYKPDEYPEKFKEIQVAYKSALAMRQWQTEIRHDNVLTETDIDSQYQGDDFIIEKAPELDEESIDELKQQDELIENLYIQLHEMAFAPLVVKNKLENWEFIEDFYKIYDLTLKPQIARAVFKKVAEYNLFQAKQNKTLLIQASILKYFNIVFNWNSLWTELEAEFPASYFQVTFYYIDSEIKFSGILDDIASPLQRVWSFTLDFIIASVLTLPFVIFQVGGYISISILISLFILIRLWVEFTNKNHTSYGKKISRYIIIDEYGNTSSKRHTIIRHIVLNLSLTIVLYMPLYGFHGDEIYSILYGLVIVINLFTLMSKKVLFHDYVSGTYVISQ